MALSQESNAPCAGSSGKAKQFVAQISQTRAYGLLLIRTCPHFGVSTPGDPTRVRAKDNLKLIMLVKEIGVRTFWSSWKIFKSLPFFLYWIAVFIQEYPLLFVFGVLSVNLKPSAFFSSSNDHVISIISLILMASSTTC